VPGGKLDANEMSVGGPLADDTFRRFFADVCVLGASGVDPDVGITEQDHEVAALHRLMMERAQRVLLLADHSKIGFRAAAVVGPMGHGTTLVTDEDVPAHMQAALRTAGVEIVCVGQTLRTAALPGAS
jgi:DeoR/GlpR family transcriptional regulator of sugar metabolism